jgi:hypothetical protein
MNHIRFHDLPVLYDVDATTFIEKATVLIVLFKATTSKQE